MNRQRMLLIISVSLAVIAAGSSRSAVAHPGGGGGGGSHGAGGSHGGGGYHGGSGFHGGGYHGGGGFRGGGDYRGGWHGGGGYRHGWYEGGYYGAWGGGLGYGLLFATLPWYYATYWWDGAPYYYADDVYYQWNGDAAEYQTVRAPPGLSDQVKAQTPVVSELFMYPKAGQASAQQARDRDECHRWAVGQAGFDPTAAAASAGSPTASRLPEDSTAAKRADYLRADGACLEARNYSVK